MRHSARHGRLRGGHPGPPRFEQAVPTSTRPPALGGSREGARAGGFGRSTARGGVGLNGLSHIGLKSTDLARTERFYTEVLEGAIVRRREVPDRRVWLMVCGVRLEISERPAWGALDDEQRRALPTVSFLVAPGEVDPIVERLKATGVPHHGPVLKATGIAVGVYFSDPDGNPLSLSCNEGYARDGLSHRAQDWTPEPYGFAP